MSKPVASQFYLVLPAHRKEANIRLDARIIGAIPLYLFDHRDSLGLDSFKGRFLVPQPKLRAGIVHLHCVFVAARDEPSLEGRDPDGLSDDRWSVTQDTCRLADILPSDPIASLATIASATRPRSSSFFVIRFSRLRAATSARLSISQRSFRSDFSRTEADEAIR